MKLVQKSVSVILSLAMVLSMVTGISFSTSAAEIEGFVHSEGTHFILNGNSFYVTGCNSYDLHRIGTWEVDKLMQEMQDNGVNVCRTWAFSTDWYCGFESYSNGQWNYHEDRFRQLDYIMNSAKQHGIKMILTLENYWEGFGGIDKKLEALGMDSETHQARSKWYTNETCKNWYKAYAEHLINRTNTYTGVKYKDDPTLFAWGLMNEARFQDSGEDYSSTTLRRWVDEMGAYVKSLDPNHMVSIELEGHGQKYGFGNDEGNNFVYVQQSPYVDYCSVHIYPDEQWCDMSVDTTANIMNMLINDAHNAVGKPIIVGEFNGSRTNPKLIDYWKAVFGTLYNKDAAGALFWNYSTNYIDKHTVMKGDYILDYFKEMSQKYAAKSMHISDDSDNSDESDDDTKTNTKVIECEAYANAKYANKAGVTTASSLGGYTGTGYASLNGTNTLYIPFTAPKAGTYTFAVSYARPQGKSADIYIDRYDNYSGASYNTFTVDGTKYYQNAYQQVGSGSSSQWSTKTVSYSFGAGETKLIGLTDNNKVAYFDKIVVTAPGKVFDKEDTESSIADSSSVAESSEIESSSIAESSSEIVEESSSEADNVVKTNTKTIECEDYANASYTNSGNVTTETSLNGYTGTGFASLNGAKTLFIPFTAPKAGTYTFTVSYAKPQNGNADIYFDRFDNYSGASYSTFTVDGVTYYQNAYQQVGSGSSSQWSTFTVTHQFNAGETKLIGLTDNNKVAYFDKIVVTAPEAVFVVENNEDSSEVVEDSSSEIVEDSSEEDSSSVAESSEDDSSSEVIEES
ncbi:MAG: hypothetical protein IJU04_03640, partial [Ruminococcus sp.]|nr:hypothetical protein [Ruminococcus sp.]